MKQIFTLLFSILLVGNVKSQSQVAFSEIHYDNVGTDANERIEIIGPAGTDVTGWSIVLYNGNIPVSAVVYNTQVLSGTIPNNCTRTDGTPMGVMVVSYPVDGIQNGSPGPDGMALVDGSGAVIEFLSYEGVMIALDGPAIGLISTDIGVAEDATGTLDGSIQREVTNTWITIPGSNTFGACNGIDILPVRLVSFTGNIKNGDINLNWKTNNEINLDKYIIEKSSNGLEFHTTATLPASNKDNSDYSYTDRSIGSAIVFYRLKMVDKDGKYVYSNIVKVNNTSSQLNLSVYPSPTKSTINAEFTADKSEQVTIQVVDVTGKVGLLQKVTLQKGYNNLPINTSLLSTGRYILKITGTHTSLQQSFIKN